MNKGDLINEVAKFVSTKKEAQEAVDCVFSSITKAMKTGDPVTLVGFGTFKVVERKARKGRNPLIFIPPLPPARQRQVTKLRHPFRLGPSPKYLRVAI